MLYKLLKNKSLFFCVFKKNFYICHPKVVYEGLFFYIKFVDSYLLKSSINDIRILFIKNRHL